jgi:hypothetical protein
MIGQARDLRARLRRWHESHLGTYDATAQDDIIVNIADTPDLVNDDLADSVSNHFKVAPDDVHAA